MRGVSVLPRCFSALLHHLSHLISCAPYADVHIAEPWSVHLNPPVVRGLGGEANGPARSQSKRPRSPSPSPKTLAPWLSIPRELPVSSASQIKHQLFKHQESLWRSPHWRLEVCFVDSLFSSGAETDSATAEVGLAESQWASYVCMSVSVCVKAGGWVHCLAPIDAPTQVPHFCAKCLPWSSRTLFPDAGRMCRHLPEA